MRGKYTAHVKFHVRVLTLGQFADLWSMVMSFLPEVTSSTASFERRGQSTDFDEGDPQAGGFGLMIAGQPEAWNEDGGTFSAPIPPADRDEYIAKTALHKKGLRIRVKRRVRKSQIMVPNTPRIVQ